jgi:phosphate transport system substrate-binding protein
MSLFEAMKSIKKPILLIATIATISVVLVMYCCKPKSTDPTNEIVIKGSDSELNLMKFLSAEYQKKQDILFDISGGGTSKGIEAFIKGEVDIANASRLISDDELNEANKNGIHPVSYIIASDVVAIITHPEVGVDSISMRQLSKVLHGDIQNWKELGGSDMAIKIYGRDHNSGTRHFLMQSLNCENFSDLHTGFKTNKEIIDAVSKEKGAIGYVNLGSIVNKEGRPTDKIWAMNLYAEGIPSCSPYEKERVKNSEYLLTRPLIQYVNEKSDEKIIGFIRFELQEEQQLNLEEHGFFHINENHMNLNKKNGL